MNEISKGSPELAEFRKRHDIETANRMHCDVKYLNTREGIIKGIIDDLAILGILKMPGAARDEQGRLIYDEHGEIIMLESNISTSKY